MVRYHDERRTVERYAYSNRVSCKILGTTGKSHGETTLQGKAVDISTRGIRIETGKAPLVRGCIVQVNVPVSRFKVLIPVLTEVKWLSEKPSGVFQIGLQFLPH